MALEDLMDREEFSITEESNEAKNFYIKSVTDIDVEELVVYFQESNYQIVKDICVDRELSFQEKCSVENCELDHNIISCILNSDLDRNSDLNSETVDRLPCISDGSKCIFEHDCSEDVTKQIGSVNFVMDGDVEIDARDDNSIDHYAKNIIPETLLLLQENPIKETALATNSMLLLPSEAIDNGHSSEAAAESEVDYGSIGIIDQNSVYQHGLQGESSSQSFRFPILSSDWNGSPVRMAKADRRGLQLQKHHRIWRKRFLCCKF